VLASRRFTNRRAGVGSTGGDPSDEHLAVAEEARDLRGRGGGHTPPHGEGDRTATPTPNDGPLDGLLLPVREHTQVGE